MLVQKALKNFFVDKKWKKVEKFAEDCLMDNNIFWKRITRNNERNTVVVVPQPAANFSGLRFPDKKRLAFRNLVQVPKVWSVFIHASFLVHVPQVRPFFL